MKIALFTHELGLSGAPRALFNMAKCLRSLGHEVVVYSPFRGELKDEFEEEDIPVIFKHDLLGEKEVTIEENYDVIIYNTIVSLVSAKNTQSLKGKRIAWVHEGFFAYELFSKTDTAYGLGRKLNFNELFNYVDEVYCVSDYSAEITENYTDKKIKILPYYIEHIEHERNHREHYDLTVGMIGTVEKRKGIDLVMDAVKNAKFDIKVILIGGIDRGYAEKIVNKNPKISYIGRMSHDVIMKSYDRFDLVMCPSMDDPMPIVCAEAFMMGCPVLVSENTGTYSLIDNKKNGIVCEYNSNSLLKALEWCYRNKKLLKDIGVRGKEIYKENFTYNVFEENIKQML
jgi:glycosyltransferase involved in cell wall biosynthesis